MFFNSNLKFSQDEEEDIAEDCNNAETDNAETSDAKTDNEKINPEDTNQSQVLTKDWYAAIEKQSNSNFVNLPIEFQLRGYDYNFIAKSYLNFFMGESNTRDDKLVLAKKFLRFIRNINKNRAKFELGEDFFLCFHYFMENFATLLAKQDTIHLETLEVISQAIDKSQFLDDVISLDELQKRIKNLKAIQENETIILTEWSEFENEYAVVQSGRGI